jgi:small subunit ribosomal protein S17
MNTTALEKKEDTKPRILTGKVVSCKMQDTVVVSVVRFVRHPKYKKFVKMMKKYHVHDKGNLHKEGDIVSIRECRPISKTKHFTVVEGEEGKEKNA